MSLAPFRGPYTWGVPFRKWLEELVKVVNGGISVAWGSIIKTGSKLSDIETRKHSDLQNIEQANGAKTDGEPGKHITNAQARKWDNMATGGSRSVLLYVRR